MTEIFKAISNKLLSEKDRFLIASKNHIYNDCCFSSATLCSRGAQLRLFEIPKNYTVYLFLLQSG